MRWHGKLMGVWEKKNFYIFDFKNLFWTQWNRKKSSKITLFSHMANKWHSFDQCITYKKHCIPMPEYPISKAIWEYINIEEIFQRNICSVSICEYMKKEEDLKKKTTPISKDVSSRDGLRGWVCWMTWPSAPWPNMAARMRDSFEETLVQCNEKRVVRFSLKSFLMARDKSRHLFSLMFLSYIFVFDFPISIIENFPFP